jgi:hypothetical protein
VKHEGGDAVRLQPECNRFAFGRGEVVIASARNNEDACGSGIGGGEINVDRGLIGRAQRERSRRGPQRKRALLRGGNGRTESEAGEGEEESPACPE